MKVKDFLDGLDPKQRERLSHLAETGALIDLEGEVDVSIDGDVMEFLKALSNPLRLRILKLLKEGWLCVCLIATILKRDQTLISHHLRILKSLGLLKERREGKMRFYRTDTEILREYLSRVSSELV
ncbi:transcriptional regulator [Thermococcus sp. P6]|uniref:ArsR/SmtB family transcription factor n=1 Tax=Thermococcus sp. P6 TaxID=122420 RepID=UPI000B59D44D|nr:metalloregulator ArsR/SmtB family transcription factor [Thermococcus sp. P6]ASJ10793.1 transcriptional regulator [Thermococcus sp. P6]